jgi:N-acetyl-gamma-glutamyl-phosphate reductase
MGSKMRVGVIGARGYAGRELVRLLGSHPGLELGLATSSAEHGREVRPGLLFEDPTRVNLEAAKLDAVVLALPNGESAGWVQRIAPACPIVDLSADHRFDDAWIYGQPERHRGAIRGAHRVANPGCYATAMQLAIAPFLSLIEGPVHAFGVSGFSGAGSTPSPKNDPEVLRDNLFPYALVDHVHEREVTRQLAHPVRLLPHVAPFFRGLSVTISFFLRALHDRAALQERLRSRFEDEPLVRVTDEAPLVRDIVLHHEVRIGGLEVSSDRTRVALVATIDNLLGGAATQALRNLNLMLGHDERAGIE